MPVAAARRPSVARPVRRGLTTLLAAGAAVAALVGPVVGAGPATAADDVTWAVRTASNDFGSDRTSYAYGIDPGQRVEDALVVTNHGDEPLELAVYAADGYTTDAGQFDVLTPDLESTGVGAWIEVDTGSPAGTVTVPAGGSVDVPFTVDVPQDAMPGDHAGAIVTSLVQQDAAEGITVDRRLGVRVSLRVGGELQPSLAVEDVHLGYAGTADPVGRGDAEVTYTLHNTGNTVLSARQAVTVAGPAGVLSVAAGALEDPPALLPGETWTVTVPVDGVVPTLRLGAEVTVNPVLTDASGSTSTMSPVVGTAHAWAVPWTLLALVTLLVVAAVLVPRRVRRARRLRATREDERVEAAVQEALRERAGALSGTSAADRD